ncbi:hypothetical protein NSP_14290 [Nodularia spumigena CCY9414]|nr:hypothetical protein NSP_14290 [Nodularia spumigena CCY9414]
MVKHLMKLTIEPDSNKRNWYFYRYLDLLITVDGRATYSQNI